MKPTFQPRTERLGCPRRALYWLSALMVSTLLCAGCSRSEGPAPGSPASLEEVNRALAVWVMQHGRAPTDINQLTNLPGMQNRKLPQPPPGQKLVINPRTQRVEFVPE